MAVVAASSSWWREVSVEKDKRERTTEEESYRARIVLSTFQLRNLSLWVHGWPYRTTERKSPSKLSFL